MFSRHFFNIITPIKEIKFLWSKQIHKKKIIRLIYWFHGIKVQKLSLLKLIKIKISLIEKILIKNTLSSNICYLAENNMFFPWFRKFSFVSLKISVVSKSRLYDLKK